MTVTKTMTASANPARPGATMPTVAPRARPSDGSDRVGRTSTTSTSASPSGTSTRVATIVIPDGGDGNSVAVKPNPKPIKYVPQPATDGLKHCWDFTWQQDAQAAYAKNLSDPAGLDSAVGPFNGDGLACTLLPVDPKRPASTPVGAYVPPRAVRSGQSRPRRLGQEVLRPDHRRRSLRHQALDAVNTEVGKTPSLLQWFTNWNQTATAKAAGYSGAFRADAVKTAWSRGALPVITWQSMDSGFVPTVGESRADQPDYTLANILAGNFDDYIRQFAVDIVKTNLPVAIRLDQEMNADFYPWCQRTALNGNTKGDAFAQMWRHVWTIFQNVGANDDTMWIWAPNRVDMLGNGQDSQSVFNRFYPGDQYVDWLGLDAYWRYPTKPTDFDSTFAKTVNLLKHTAPLAKKVDKTVKNTKPIFLAEVGALGESHDDPPVDLTPQKTTWLQGMFAGVLADPQIIGFAYFDNVATQVSGPVVISNDWRIDSNPTILATFKAGVADDRFSGGLALDDSPVLG